jgi:hypothetical protein
MGKTSPSGAPHLRRRKPHVLLASETQPGSALTWRGAYFYGLRTDQIRRRAACDRWQGGGMTVTVERLDRAIATTARVMVDHDLPQLIETIRYLEAARA